MKKSTWRKHHKWLGLIFGFFLVMFCISGIILNHRDIFGDINISRSWLPDSYKFHNWNNGLLRGTLSLGKDSVLIFGAGGCFVATDNGKTFCDYSKNLPHSADMRAMRSVVKTDDSTLYGCSQFGFYRCRNGVWIQILDSNITDKRFANLSLCNDTLILVGRNHLYLKSLKSDIVTEKTLLAPAGYRKEVSMFKTVWNIHSGEIFGLAGKVFMDCVALLIIFLVVSGIVFFVKPNKWWYKYHELFGRKTIIITMFVLITGWCLRPPVMIALVKIFTSPIPYSVLDSNNPFNDKLRHIKYDSTMNDYLLSTSEGFYSLKNLNSQPQFIDYQPIVSVMGINVFEKLRGEETWLIGSFSGLYIWNRQQNIAIDAFTKQPAPTKAGAPFGNRAISGFSQDFTEPVVAEYYTGTDKLSQPETFETLPMSLWNLALEVHTGRIYTILGNIGSLFWIFIAGIIVFWILLSGWKIRKHQVKK